MQRKPFPFPLLPAPCPPYRRRYIFHGSESFSWTSAFTALPKYCVGSPAPAWLPSPSALMFSRLPRLALVLDIWNKNTDTASSPARSCGHCQSGCPQDHPVESCFFKERRKVVCTGCLNCSSKAQYHLTLWHPPPSCHKAHLVVVSLVGSSEASIQYTGKLRRYEMCTLKSLEILTNFTEGLISLSMLNGYVVHKAGRGLIICLV